jgi:hypothetical protein
VCVEEEQVAAVCALELKRRLARAAVRRVDPEEFVAQIEIVVAAGWVWGDADVAESPWERGAILVEPDFGASVEFR